MITIPVGRALAACSLAALLYAAGVGFAADDKAPVKRGKVEIDIEKLPPELARQIIANMKAADKNKNPEREKDDDKGPPANPGADAKGRKLAEFIRAAVEKGLTGQALAEAIRKERARLGINDDPPENEKDEKGPPVTPGKKK